MSEKTSDRLLTAHGRMLEWCAANGGVPAGYVEDAMAEIGFWALVEQRTNAEFAAAMFAQWQQTQLAREGEAG